MLNLEVALSSFWQLARHWKQGESAKLELSCEDGNLSMQLSARLGHPDKPHFPDPLPPPQPSPKKKSPSQLRRQERRREEPQSKAAEALPDPEPLVKSVPQQNNSEKVDATLHAETVFTEAAGKSASPGIQFKCDQCSYESASDKGVRQHIRMKHRISQLDGQDDCEVNSSDSEKHLCPLCPEDSCCCGKCEECEYIATEEGFNCHIMNDMSQKMFSISLE